MLHCPIPDDPIKIDIFLNFLGLFPLKIAVKYFFFFYIYIYILDSWCFVISGGSFRGGVCLHGDLHESCSWRQIFKCEWFGWTMKGEDGKRREREVLGSWVRAQRLEGFFWLYSNDEWIHEHWLVCVCVWREIKSSRLFS